LPASILLARLLGPAGKGEVTLALLLPAMVGLFTNLGVGPAAAYLIGSRRFPANDVIDSLVGFWLSVCVLLVPAYVAAAALGWFAPLTPGVQRGLLLFSALMLPFSLGRQYLGYAVLGQQRFVRYNFTQVIGGSANLLGIALLVWAWSLGAMGAVTAAVAGEALCLAYLLVVLREHWSGRPAMSRPILREAVSFGLRGQIGNILQFFNYRLDVILLGNFRDLREVGLYSLAVSLGEFIWYIPSASAMVIFPRTSASVEGASRFTPQVFRVTAALTFFAAGCLAALSQWLIVLVFGGAFRASVSPLLLLLPGIVCLGAAKVLSADLSGRGLPQYNALGSLLTLVVTVGLDLLLIPIYGMNGAAVASTLAYFVTLIYTLCAYARLAGVRISELLRLDREDLRAVWVVLRRRLPWGLR
jgi:O-antigen/teichoic acid export membrane protein